VRRIGLAALTLLIAASGCGGGSGHRSAPAANAPEGRLSPAEYRAILREYRQLRPLQQSHGDGAALQRGRRACAALRKPGTELVARVRKDCDNAIWFFQSLNGLEQAGSNCTSGSTRDQVDCARAHYSRMAAAIRATREGGVAINSELRRRRITGLCADSIGMTSSQVAAYRSAEQAARDAVDAIAAGDPLGFEQATNTLTNALDAGGGGDPLTGIEQGCRPRAAQPAPQRTTPTPTTPAPTQTAPSPAPKSKPKHKHKPLPQLPGGGINA
jgi:hypothetical protein